jgi:predicted ABC-type exoprotein transport system permease subunit
MGENLFNKFNKYLRDIKNDEITSVVVGLFALIGFIILVYSVFILIFREPLTLVANTVVVAIIIVAFTSIGIIMGKKMIYE